MEINIKNEKVFSVINAIFEWLDRKARFHYGFSNRWNKNGTEIWSSNLYWRNKKIEVICPIQ